RLQLRDDDRTDTLETCHHLRNALDAPVRLEACLKDGEYHRGGCIRRCSPQNALWASQGRQRHCTISRGEGSGVELGEVLHVVWGALLMSPDPRGRPASVTRAQPRGGTGRGLAVG